MKTYQDFLSVGDDWKARMNFVHALVEEYRSSTAYKEAEIAFEYAKKRNRTICTYQKLLYTVTGKAVPDNYTANWKMTSNFLHRFITQEAQYLLGNGVTWNKDDTAGKVGDDFDSKLQKVTKYALIGGVAFGFWNFNRMEVFKNTEFIPLYDENNSAMMAGVRFWQISSEKPLRATLYETEGYTEYIWKHGEGEIMKPRTPYILKMKTTKADGTMIYDYSNYPTLPIVPIWGNEYKQSELVGIREQIDCYDLIKSGFANDVDDASQIYWVIQNAGGMDEIDLAKFVERMKTVRAAIVEDDGAKAEAHTLDVPYESREKLLDRLSKDLYRDAMALDTERIVAGATTATQIKAAYEPLNAKTDELEYCVLDFLKNILAVAGITDEQPTFTRSMVLNKAEEIGNVLQCVNYLDPDYITQKTLTIIGDGDKAYEMIEKIHNDKELHEMLLTQRGTRFEKKAYEDSANSYNNTSSGGGSFDKRKFNGGDWTPNKNQSD